MDMNKAFFLKKADHKPRWRHIDAEGKVLGRLATQIADALRGKDKATFTPQTDGGDYIVVTNVEKAVLTGNKWEDKTYVSHSGWMGGKKEISAKDLAAKHPTILLEKAVERMLPKNRIARSMMKKLKVYAGSEHPHSAQIK